MTATSSQTADQAAAAAAVSLITAVRGGMRPEQVGYLAGLAVADLRRGADARGVEGDYAIGVLVVGRYGPSSSGVNVTVQNAVIREDADLARIGSQVAYQVMARG